ncbi:MAG: single-stranded DNA-binding protein [Yaniella sp.]|uniref:single-stranded DNA-binding protein n=1 Tax=Yaniella sp. TaxID=2773929 RepID=UPI0026470E6A|nr:single-stranded DNA-binding protein [Yaniella sp.]MDN5730685.1 single-stranded DNA-binding protein [Yaniella sp.]MDN5815993.1 single-stranded DNA-binding protein [Yaniella sp.]MDN5889651.1 single-stranded DNA-binding protein [Yaniella sp.]MDN5912706.1 single-stranded DNA-binding protein [Yaniella sp.]MDN6149184.1 single-stranded DNA-binding protein [Yaniella sp.]
MAGEPYITVVGNLAGDPELRFTASGHAVANFTIAQTPRTRNQQSGEWVDDETLWVRASVWRDVAENVAESLTKGMRVVAHGRLKARSFETKEGQQRTNWELDVDEIGPSLRWATAQVNRTPRSGGGGFGGGGQGAPGGNWGGAPAGGGGGWGQPAPNNDPWGGGGSAGSWDQGNDSPPPF